FSGIGIPEGRRRWLVALHCLGCLAFSSVFVLLGLDQHPGPATHNSLVGSALGGSLALLFPIHIYAGLKRRIAIKDRDSRAPVWLAAIFLAGLSAPVARADADFCSDPVAALCRGDAEVDSFAPLDESLPSMSTAEYLERLNAIQFDGLKASEEK